MDGLSDNDSVNTEDFASKFTEMTTKKSGNLTKHESCRPAAASTRSWLTSSVRANRTRDADDESVRTEDFENRFRSMYTKAKSTTPALPHEARPSGRSQLKMGGAYTPQASTRRSELGGGDISNVPAMRRDILSKFMEKYTDSQDHPVVSPRRTRSRSPEHTGRSKVAFRSGYAAATYEVPSYKQITISPIPEKKFLSEEDLATEIRLRTDQIKREIQNERQRVQPTYMESGRSVRSEVNRSSTPGGLTPRETLDKKVLELDRLTSSARRAKAERDHLSGELESLEDNLRKNMAEVRLNEKMVKDSRAKAEDMKMEMMLAEAKRDTTRQDLDKLGDELSKRKRQMKELEDKMRERLDEIQDLEALGLTRDEIESVIAERNELYEILKMSEDNENQRYELEKKLSAVKEDLTHEQKRSREAVVALEEELEASFGKIADLRKDKERLSEEKIAADKKVRLVEKKLESSISDCEDLRNEYEATQKDHSLELKKVQESQSENVLRHQGEQEAQLRAHLQQVQETNDRLRKDLDEVRRINEGFSEQIQNLEMQLEAANRSREECNALADRQILNLKEEREKEITLLKEELTHHQSTESSEFRQKLESEKTANINEMKEVYQKQVKEMQTLIESKDEEVTYLKSHIRLQEANFSHAAKDFDVECQEKVKDAVEQERVRWEVEQEARWKGELDSLKVETTRVITGLQDELGAEKKTIAALEDEIEGIKKEREGSELEFSKTVEQKKAENEEARIAFREEIQRLQEEHAKDLSEATQGMKCELEQTSTQLTSTKAELVECVEECEAKLLQLGSSINTAIVNECRKIADIIRIEPPKVTCAGKQVTRDNVIEFATECLSHLGVCTDEVKTFVHELVSQSEKKASKLKDLEKEKSREIEKIKKAVEEEKARETAVFKERMLKDHFEEIQKLARTPDEKSMELLREKDREIRDLNANMKKWKEKTAECMAIKLQNEFKGEFEKKLQKATRGDRLVHSLPMVGQRDLDWAEKEMAESRGTSSDAVKIISHLKDSVKKLREENLSLRKVLLGRSSQVPPPLTISSQSDDNSVGRRRTHHHHSDDGNESDRTLEPEETRAPPERDGHQNSVPRVSTPRQSDRSGSRPLSRTSQNSSQRRIAQMEQ